MPVKKYTHSKKEKLVEKINKLKKKEDYIEIYKIISKNNDTPIKELDNSILLFFHNLKNKTYYEIENFLEGKITEKKINDLSECTEEYKPYSQDDFITPKIMNTKLKYSNKEKNLIKRKRYDEILKEENGSDVVYCQFSLDNISE